MLALVGGLHCSSSEPGVSVDIGVSHHLGDDPEFEGVRYGDGDVRGLTNAAGYGVVLHEAYVVMSAFELVPCPESRAEAAMRWLLGASVAHAHSGGSARVLGVPHVLDLMARDRSLLAQATMEPPPGAYCEVRVEIAPADADAVGLPDDVDMVGTSLHLAGSFVAPGTQRSVDFELRSDLTRDGRLEFQRAAQGGGGVELSEPGMPRELRLDLHYGGLFEEVEFDLQGLADQEFFVITNLLQSMAVIVCDGGEHCAMP